jgi:hypothetical protein
MPFGNFSLLLDFALSPMDFLLFGIAMASRSIMTKKVPMS